MRAIHKVRVGGTGRHPSIQEQLFVGTAPYGQRCGTSGNPVNAVCVATGAGCHYKWIDLLSDEQIIRLAAVSGPLNGRKAKRLAGLITSDLVGEVLILKLERVRQEALRAAQAARDAIMADPTTAVRAWIEKNRPHAISGSKGSRRAANKAAYQVLGVCPAYQGERHASI